MSVFRFKQFEINQSNTAMKVGTDGVLLGAWVNCRSALSVLDIGTGTGVIALMIAQRYPDSRVDAIEFEIDACEQALSNIANSKFRDQISVFQSSLEEWLKFTTRKYDMIICNPPFYSKGFSVTDEKRKKARVAESLPPDQLLRAFSKLTDNGKLNLILPTFQANEFIESAQNHNYYCCRKTMVFSKPGRDPIRYLLEFSKLKSKMIENSLMIGDGGINNFTAEYRELTKDFYLNF